jgi:hypothetical protein
MILSGGVNSIEEEREMRKKILLVLVVSLFTSIGSGLAARQTEGSAPERTGDAFL